MTGQNLLEIPCEEIPGMDSFAGQKVVLRKVTFGDKSDMLNDLLEINPTTLRPTNNIRLGDLRKLALVYGIDSAPFFAGEERVVWENGLQPHQKASRLMIVRNLSDEASFLFEKISSFNPNLIGGSGGGIKNSEQSSQATVKTH